MNGINDPQKTVFIDESGNNGFDFSKDDVSSHYIVVAVVMDTVEVNSNRLKADKIRQKYFPRGEIKSSRCPDTGTRFKILSDLMELDFSVVAVIVNKKEIYDDSNIIKFREVVFYKFLNKLLYSELKNYNSDMAVWADEYKDKEFMESFSKYIDPLLPKNLIDNNSFEFVNSKDEALIQTADFIAGTLAYGYEENKKVQNVYKGYYGVLREKATLIPWPSPKISNKLQLIGKNNYNKLIAENCIRIVEDYISKHRKENDEQHIDQILVLRHLLNDIYLKDPHYYSFIDELRNYIYMITGRKYERHIFQTHILASMKDEGVILASSSSGIKIPLTEQELNAHTNRILGQAIPLLERLEKVRNKILAITDNKLDIIESEQYTKIRDYMDKKP